MLDCFVGCVVVVVFGRLPGLDSRTTSGGDYPHGLRKLNFARGYTTYKLS